MTEITLEDILATMPPKMIASTISLEDILASESVSQEDAKTKAWTRYYEVQSSVVMREADYGRQGVYDRELFAYRSLIDERVIYDSIASVRALVYQVVNDRRVMAIDHFAGEPITVVKTCGKKCNANAFFRRIRSRLPVANFVILHEIAHILTPGDRHGKLFCEVECKLFSWFISENAGQTLATAMRVR